MSRTTRAQLETLVTILNDKIGTKEGDDQFIQLEIQTLERVFYKLCSFNGSTNVSSNMVAKECEIFIRGMLAGVAYK